MVVIGVHSAKFPNERKGENLRQVVERHGITHPVINDADFRIWQAYGVQAWPTLCLIDPEGYIAFAVAGEGNGPFLEEAITHLIEEHRMKGTLREGPRPFFIRRAIREGFLAFPGKVLADPTRLFIADTGHHRIVIADRTGKILDIAGSGEPGADDGPFERASFHRPQGMAVADDLLYVADPENHLIRRLDLTRRVVETIAGSGRKSLGPPRRGVGRWVDLNSPWDLALHRKILYIAMAGCHQIWTLDLDTLTLNPFAGSGREELRDGPHHESGLNQPSGLALDGMTLYVADSEASAIRAIELHEHGRVTTLVGQGLFEFGDRDGVGEVVRLQHPLGVTVFDGKVYIADTYNHKIKVLDPSLRRVRTLFGQGRPGSDEGRDPAFFEPSGLSAISGRLFIADTNNHRVCVADLGAGMVSALSLC